MRKKSKQEMLEAINLEKFMTQAGPVMEKVIEENS